MKSLPKKTVLLTGGAGYIGSHTAFLLAHQGYRVVIIDNAHVKEANPFSWATYINANIATPGALEAIFAQHAIDAVMHFAGFIEVGESVKHPDIFYHNNVINTHILLNAMLKHDVKKIIFSSTCAIYGTPQYLPLDEQHPLNPLSPYGKTKLTIEFMLQDYADAFGLDYVSLRYFNAAGCLPEHGLGEHHNPETHIIPLVLQAIKNGTSFTIFGKDYKTPDGTCIRDYVHVIDIAQAHIASLAYLEDGGASDVFNVGTGSGFSVLQIIAVAEKVCRSKLSVLHASRRAGDAAVLIANPEKIYKKLEWNPQFSNLELMLSNAWSYMLTNPVTITQERNKHVEL